MTVNNPLAIADARFRSATSEMISDYVRVAKAVQINTLNEALQSEVCPWCNEDFAGWADLHYEWTTHVIQSCPKRPQA